MPRAGTRRKPDPDAFFIAWTSAAIREHVIAKGRRLRGDHPAVQHAPHLFVADGTTPDEISRIEAADIERELAAVRRPASPPAPEPLRDEDAVVAVRDAGGQVARNAPGPDGVSSLSAANFVYAGERVGRDHPAVKRDRNAFVDVTRGVPRSEALVAQQTLRNLAEDGSERVLYAGQWARYDDKFVTAHRPLFRPPDPETNLK